MKFTFAWLLSLNLQAAEYIQIGDDDTLYRVEVLVFARNLMQDDASVTSNGALVDVDAARTVQPPEPDVPLIVKPDGEHSGGDAGQWNVPINETGHSWQALAWYRVDDAGMTPLWQVLQGNPQYRPLLMQAWIQPATPFTQPGYVQLAAPALPERLDETEIQADRSSAWPRSSDTTSSHNDATDPLWTLQFNAPEDTQDATADFTLRGRLAFSEGRYMHLHSQFNLYRRDGNGEEIIHSLMQQRQVKPGELHYFDHPQFGVLARVTEFKPEHQDPRAQ